MFAWTKWKSRFVALAKSRCDYRRSRLMGVDSLFHRSDLSSWAYVEQVPIHTELFAENQMLSLTRSA